MGLRSDGSLSALFMLLTAILTLLAADTRRSGLWWLAAACALVALFAHESGIAALLLAPCLLWLTGRRDKVRIGRLWPFGRRRCLRAGGRACELAQSAADHGRLPARTAHGWPRARLHRQLVRRPARGEGLCHSVAALLAVAALGTTPARVGLMWMFVTMLPFLGFFRA